VNVFQLMKLVLDDSYRQIVADSETEKDKIIKLALAHLSDKYRVLLTKAQMINYAHPAIRFAYIFKYTTSHSNLVFQAIQSCAELGSIFDSQRVKVSCIGGGPGSDFLGILKYLIRSGKRPDLRFYLFDKEQSWADSWCDVEDHINVDFRFSTQYQHFDVAKPSDWTPHTKYLESDIFTMIYFMSEVHGLRPNSDAFFRNLFSRAKQGSFFLFIDNNNPGFFSWFDELASDRGVRILHQQNCVQGLPTHEEKADLGDYFSRFGSPKIQSNCACRVGVKE
jgi:SAM-dependent methyltransferase